MLVHLTIEGQEFDAWLYGPRDGFVEIRFPPRRGDTWHSFWFVAENELKLLLKNAPEKGTPAYQHYQRKAALWVPYGVRRIVKMLSPKL